jgi:hypothetical protein
MFTEFIDKALKLRQNQQNPLQRSLVPPSRLAWPYLDEVNAFGSKVSKPLLRMWVHCPRASSGLLPRRSNLVGYVRWDARSDRFPPCQTTQHSFDFGLGVKRAA